MSRDGAGFHSNETFTTGICTHDVRQSWGDTNRASQFGLIVMIRVTKYNFLVAISRKVGLGRKI